MEASHILFREADVLRTGRVDVRVAGGTIVEVGPQLTRQDELVVDLAGGALLPGLHDHHSHLLAAAAAQVSVPCGPPEVRTADELAERLRAARPRGGWIRGVGYHESVAGELDSTVLTGIVPDVPVRVQHRSGALWVVNGPGAKLLALDDADEPGIERNASGSPVGRLWRLDGWLRARLAGGELANISALSAELARFGVTGVTDATPDLDADGVRALRHAGLQQRLTTLGEVHGIDGVGLGPRKIVVADHALPDLAELTDRVRAARPRAVALHCVTRVSLVLALTVLREVGTRSGDRIEHAAVVPPECRAMLAELGLAVVTQPSLIARRGDGYVADIEPQDRPFLWPYASLLAAGVRVAASSDAPYGDLDPWATVAAAIDRLSPRGRQVGPHERVDAWTALRGFLTKPTDPGGRLRAVRAGAPADLVAFDRPLAVVLTDLPERRPSVLATVISGRLVHRAPA